MGNTSDRVTGDRHGAKSQRSDSSGSPKDQEHIGKMVDSTDDPNIFNTHGPETKVLLCKTDNIETFLSRNTFQISVSFLFIKVDTSINVF